MTCQYKLLCSVDEFKSFVLGDYRKDLLMDPQCLA